MSNFDITEIVLDSALVAQQVADIADDMDALFELRDALAEEAANLLYVDGWGAAADQLTADVNLEELQAQLNGFDLMAENGDYYRGSREAVQCVFLVQEALEKHF